MKKLTFNINQDNQPLIEDVDGSNYSNSLLEMQYLLALKEIDEYVGATNLTSYDYSNRNLQSMELENNIFAFVGDRGTGKTSAMLNVAQILTNADKLSSFQELINIRNHKFYCSKIIDPAFFDAEHNILSLFIARLFREFQEQHKESKNEEQRAKLMHLFTNVQRHLNCVMQVNKLRKEDDLDQLVDLSASVVLKDELCQLVDSFLLYMTEQKNATMVVLVDDIDMDPKYGSIMAEQLRKYFIQPNIIVLVALKIEQMEAIKRQDYSREYDSLLTRHTLTQNEIECMVGRYLAKFIPQKHRIYMPDSADYLRLPLDVIDNDDEVRNFDSVQEAVLELIYQKTSYLFYNTQHHASYLVPNNLRDLRQLLKFLITMQTPTTRDGSQWEFNRSIFKKYLFETWTVENISAELRPNIVELVSADNVFYLNVTTIRILNEIYQDKKDNYPAFYPDMSEIESVLDDKNSPYNISIGDILGVIGFLEHQYSNTIYRKFFFLVRTIYTLRLEEFFTEKVYSRGTNLKSLPLDHSVMLQNEELQYIPNYDKLIGGRFVNLDIVDPILLVERDEKPLSHREINLDYLSSLIDCCLNDFDHMLSIGVVRLVEFFMLATYRTIQGNFEERSSADSFDLKFRESSEVIYDTFRYKSIGIFDMGAFFFNITRVQDAYLRFEKGNELLGRIEQSQDTSKSIWGQLKRLSLFSNRKLMNLISLRNLEVLQDVINYLNNQRLDANLKAYPAFRVFFNMLSNYKLPLYHSERQEENMERGFDFFADIFANVFSQEPVVIDAFRHIYVIDEKVKSITEDGYESTE